MSRSSAAPNDFKEEQVQGAGKYALTKHLNYEGLNHTEAGGLYQTEKWNNHCREQNLLYAEPLSQDERCISLLYLVQLALQACSIHRHLQLNSPN